MFTARVEVRVGVISQLMQWAGEKNCTGTGRVLGRFPRSARQPMGDVRMQEFTVPHVTTNGVSSLKMVMNAA